MEHFIAQQQSNISYDNTIFDVDINQLALERSKTGSFYAEMYSVIKNLSIGMDLTKFQAPIFIVKPISFLELFSTYTQPNEEMLKFEIYSIHFLRVSEESDPLERMKTIASFFISSLYATNSDVRIHQNLSVDLFYGKTL
jgi:hypothetical protein